VPTYNSLTSRADASATMPEEVSREIINAMPEASLALNFMRRATMSRGQSRMPVLSALAQAYFVSGDTGMKQTTKLAWANKTLVAEEIAAIVPIPNAVLDDSDYDLWGETRGSLTEALGALIDAAVLFGASKPASWPTAIVPGAIAAGNSVVRGATANRDLAGDINAAMRLVAADGHPVNGVAADALLEFTLQDLRDSQGRPVFQSDMNTRGGGALYGREFRYLNNGAWDSTTTTGADAIVGDWRQAIIAVRQDITFTIHTEGVISNDAGAIVLNLMQQDSAAMRVVMRVGYQIANPVTRRGGLDATRYPFGVVRPVGAV
jgi:HK97 family phage major capsid protein